MNTLHSMLDACSQNPRDKTCMLVAADCAAENDRTSLEHLLRFLAADGWPVLFTGSRCYGTPREDSDWDWVWRVTTLRVWNQVTDWLSPKADTSTWDSFRIGDTSTWDSFRIGDTSTWDSFRIGDRHSNPHYGDAGISATMRFGPVNLLVCTNKSQWHAWRQGTDDLIGRARKFGPVTREEAVKVFREKFSKL